jgi:cobyrinic acid a,c-diamide synthase
LTKQLDAPVLLVVDGSAMARSVAAMVSGYAKFDPALRVVGVLFNRVNSEGHYKLLREAVEQETDVEVVGYLRPDQAVTIIDRHLGLVMAMEQGTGEFYDLLAKAAVETIDLDRVEALAQDVRGEALGVRGERNRAGQDQNRLMSHRVRIGVAQDQAFCFYYPDNLELLEGCGARLVFFSPTQDECAPLDLDGIYLGGGYPELFAGQLAANGSMLLYMREQSAAGMPMYAECGGFMYLCSELQDHQGRLFPMAGCFPFKTRMLPRMKALGYREVRLARATIIGGSGDVIRGHEFHYSETLEAPSTGEAVYRIADRAGVERPAEGYMVRRTLGSYIHLHFGSAPRAAQSFVDSCRAFRAERN